MTQDLKKLLSEGVVILPAKVAKELAEMLEISEDYSGMDNDERRIHRALTAVQNSTKELEAIRKALAQWEERLMQIHGFVNRDGHVHKGPVLSIVGEVVLAMRSLARRLPAVTPKPSAPVWGCTSDSNCPMCSGEFCAKCSSWRLRADNQCDHDVMDRHNYPEHR